MTNIDICLIVIFTFMTVLNFAWLVTASIKYQKVDKVFVICTAGALYLLISQIITAIRR